MNIIIVGYSQWGKDTLIRENCFVKITSLSNLVDLFGNVLLITSTETHIIVKCFTDLIIEQ